MNLLINFKFMLTKIYYSDYYFQSCQPLYWPLYSSMLAYPLLQVQQIYDLHFHQKKNCLSSIQLALTHATPYHDFSTGKFSADIFPLMRDHCQEGYFYTDVSKYSTVVYSTHFVISAAISSSCRVCY